MHLPRQFLGQRRINLPLPRHPALAHKGGGHDCHGEVRLAPRPGPFVARMTMGFIQDLESSRDEPLNQLPTDRISDAHLRALTV